MANFVNNINAQLAQNLLKIYDRVMYLKLFVDSDDNSLKNKYVNAAINHNNKLQNAPTCIDAGFDLFAPGNPQDENVYGDKLRFFGTGWDTSPVNKLDLNVICSAKILTDTSKQFNTGYYMYPRSSISKTQLRLANSTGIIDAGYRGHLMGMFDVVNIPQNQSDDIDADYFGTKFDRYLQICGPHLEPIIVEIVDTKEELGETTTRGEGGFGSTGR